MPSINSVLKRLKSLYPEISFVADEDFMWSSSERRVYYAVSKKPTKEDVYLLLHETGHAALGHTGYSRDVQLLKMEREAWDYTNDTLSKLVNVKIDEEFIESSLDTYRDWMHERSTCPKCGQNGLQTNKNTYKCLNCRCSWRVNDARQCQLKRYIN